MKYQLAKGSTSVIVPVYIQNTISGAGLGTLDQTSGIVGGYVRPGETGVALAVDENVTTEGTYEAPTTAGQVRIGTPANMRTGGYELHLHNDLLASGADAVFITLGGATIMADLVIEIQLTDFDLNDATPDVNVAQVSGDSTAADNLESQYDTTGLAGDTFPATQAQLNQIANVSGFAKRAASSYVLTTGTQSANTVAAVEELDGTRHEHTDDGGVMDLYYQFTIGSGVATEVVVTGYLQGNNDDLEVYGYDWVAAAWKQIGILEGQASASNGVNAYNLFVNMVGSGANEGLVRVRFTDGAFTLTGATLAIDQLFVEFSLGNEGYEGGAVWFDSNVSNTNTVVGIDGVSRNPVSTIAAVNTLLASTNLARVQVAPNSAITFAATQANQQFVGRNWTLALGGQSVSGSSIEGADVTGIGTGASEPHFNHCHFGAVTLPPCDCEDSVLESTFTFGGAGDYFFENCKSGVAGTATPALDFGAALNASNANFRAYSGGIEIQNMGAGTGSYNMSLDGHGQLVINANCSATSTVAIRGMFTVTDNASGAVTLSDDARYDVTRGGYSGGAVWIDTNASNTNTKSHNDGIETNPVSTIAAATTLAGNLNIQKFILVPGSSITLAQAYDDFIFDACHSTIALGGQSVNNAVFLGAVITGNDDGSNTTHAQYFDCVLMTNTLAQFVMTRCYFTGTLTLAQAGSYFMHQCFSGVAGTARPTLDFGSGLNASNVNVRDYSGGIEIENMGAGTGSYNMSLEGNGQLVINANCSATSTVAIRGNFTVDDNASATVTLSEEARYDTGRVADGTWDATGSEHIGAGTMGAQVVTKIDDQFDKSAAIATGAAVAGTLSTTQMTTDLTEDTDVHFKGRQLIFLSGDLFQQATDITGYDGSSKKLTYTALTEAPGIGDTFEIV